MPVSFLGVFYEKLILPITIHDNIAVTDCTHNHVPLLVYNKRCKAAKDYQILAGYIVAPNRRQSLKGRTREIAQKSMAMPVSTGQLAKYDAVEKKAIPEVIDAIEQKRLTIAVAEKVSSFDPEGQMDFINSTEKLEQISKQDYDTYVKAKKADMDL